MNRVARLAVAAVFILPGCGGDEPQSAPGSPSAESGRTTPASPNDSTTALVPLDPAARNYVEAVGSGDLEALVASFAPDATIVDVGREIRGHDAIRRWARNEVIGGRLTVLRNTPRPGGTTMLVRFEPGGSGGFEAKYDFEIANQVITRATLSYA